jgi:hypothetical protein
MSSISELMVNQPYEEATAKALEDYVMQQLSGTKKYDFEANKALLKYYQLYCEKSNHDMIINIMILSLMQLPATYYLALSYLLPPSLTSNSRYIPLSKCANFLERGAYAEFWIEFHSSSEIFASARGFVTAIRTFILENLRDTFKTILKAKFEEYLDLKSSNLEAFYYEKKGTFQVFVNKLY